MIIGLRNNGAVGWGVGSSINFNGHNGASTTPMGKIISAWDGGATNGNMSFQTSIGGTLNTRLFIKYSGNVGIANTNPTEKLHVTGNILASGTVVGASDRRLKS